MCKMLSSQKCDCLWLGLRRKTGWASTGYNWTPADWHTACSVCMLTCTHTHTHTHTQMIRVQSMQYKHDWNIQFVFLSTTPCICNPYLQMSFKGNSHTTEVDKITLHHQKYVHTWTLQHSIPLEIHSSDDCAVRDKISATVSAGSSFCCVVRWKVSWLESAVCQKLAVVPSLNPAPLSYCCYVQQAFGASMELTL